VSVILSLDRPKEAYDEPRASRRDAAKGGTSVDDWVSESWGSCYLASIEVATVIDSREMISQRYHPDTLFRSERVDVAPR
jgi:vancomycin permeability regulator SanA